MGGSAGGVQGRRECAMNARMKVGTGTMMADRNHKGSAKDKQPMFRVECIADV